MVTDYWSAFWWAFMDVTTVGSNIYAVTPTGKILSVVLAAAWNDDVSYLYRICNQSGAAGK